MIAAGTLGAIVLASVITGLAAAIAAYEVASRVLWAWLGRKVA